MVGEFQASPICTKGLAGELVVFKEAGKKVRENQCLKQSKACSTQGKVPEMISHTTEATVPKKFRESVCDQLLQRRLPIGQSPKPSEVK